MKSIYLWIVSAVVSLQAGASTNEINQFGDLIYLPVASGVEKACFNREAGSQQWPEVTCPEITHEILEEKVKRVGSDITLQKLRIHLYLAQGDCRLNKFQEITDYFTLDRDGVKEFYAARPKAPIYLCESTYARPAKLDIRSSPGKPESLYWLRQQDGKFTRIAFKSITKCEGSNQKSNQESKCRVEIKDLLIESHLEKND